MALGSTKTISSMTERQSRYKFFTTSFYENDSRDKPRTEVYEFPHFGIFLVCGGQSYCLHVPGKDSREKFELSMIESPTSMLQQDSGRIMSEITTLNMLQSLEDLGAMLEFDINIALSPFPSDIECAMLNQSNEWSIDLCKKNLI